MDESIKQLYNFNNKATH